MYVSFGNNIRRYQTFEILNRVVGIFDVYYAVCPDQAVNAFT